ncbi:RNA-binding protein Prp24 [Cristinia sonorae]|uniref:U4/U6 snRNA-associated-splicing factor PRP24 n=1 Tax=Cristinia sonorae TaxID=1940300 RepID=A0A8K0UW65_9AGAR|nr:RNA-binding protein Prp24 [Cristinia sonorae]
MDEEAALIALDNTLTKLGQNPHDLTLHAEHIRVAREAEMHEQVVAALEMLTSFFAAGDYAWLPLLSARTSTEQLETVEELQEIHALFEKGERDYLSIELLQKHVEFLIDRHARLAELGTKPEDPNSPFSTQWIRTAIAEAVSKGTGHFTESHRVWDLWRDWELDILSEAPPNVKPQLVEDVDAMLLSRLQQPHSNHDETFSTYSTFTTNYKPPDEYEPLLVQASKLRSKAVKAFERREKREHALAQSGFSLEGYAYYIFGERRAKQPDAPVLATLYERAIAEADKRRFANEPNAEEALRSFWHGYVDFLRTSSVSEDVQTQIYERGARSIPGSGEFWARYMRHLERSGQDPTAIEAVYTTAMAFGPVKADVEQLVPVFLARAGFEKRQADAREESDEQYLPLMQILFDGMRTVRKASKAGDPRLRLEKYFSQVCFNLANLPENAVEEWKDATKHYKNSYLAWTLYTDALVRNHNYDQARSVFKDVSLKNLDWPEAVWDAWVSFEQVYGSAEQMDECLDRIERARNQVTAKRAKEEKAAYEAMQVIADAEQQAAASVASTTRQSAQEDVAMDVDATAAGAGESKGKRKAEDDVEPEGHKKARVEQKPIPLKRDRENCTVIAAELPTGTTEDDLTTLFKDCGKIREVKITELQNSAIATVEFIERDSVPAALTKDKKRIQGQEIAVHLGWRSTLYVTNFPEKTDDESIRSLFGKYGTIFDVRWPSKKFKSTRRFCYVQFTSPSAANAALELHGRELEDGHPLSVLISNPERKKERTDADANDRELYVAGLSKFTTQKDLQGLFSTYGPVKGVRMTLDDRGQSKGFAFVEFEHAKDAVSALAANNHVLKNRRIAVTLADTHNKPPNPNSRKAKLSGKSVRVRNLPVNTQEPLLQQALEKIATVHRVEVVPDKNEAIVELENVAAAGKLLLHSDPVVFNGNTLTFSEESLESAGSSKSSGPPVATGGLFVPRSAASRPRAGLGSKKSVAVVNQSGAPASTSGAASSSNARSGEKKGQDDFRKMLGG